MVKETTFERYRIFSGSLLKLMAVVSMFLDHFAYLLGGELAILQLPLLAIGGRTFTGYYLLRKMGRLAFPIFCFLISEGYLHTRSKKRYALRLLLFALLSEIPFNWMVGGSILYPAKQNIYFTLLMGIGMIRIWETASAEWKKLCFLLCAVGITLLLRADYGLNGALLILLLYVLRSQPALRTVLAYPLLSGGLPAFAAFLPISLYNGKRGFIRTPLLQYVFYLFYPAHMILLLVIRGIL